MPSIFPRIIVVSLAIICGIIPAAFPDWAQDLYYYYYYSPTVETVKVYDVTSTTATGLVDVLSDGGAEITAKGVCWSTSEKPTADLPTKTNDGTGTGSFTSNINGLTPSTKYYVRAYATNSQGTAYGDEISFTTFSVGPFPSSEYFIASPGYGVKYNITDTYNGLDRDAWATFQCTGLEDQGFVTTINEVSGEYGSGSFHSNTLGGYFGYSVDDLILTVIKIGCPSSNQGYFYRLFSLPDSFQVGDTWTFTEIHYDVERVDSLDFNGTVFNDCIKINVDTTNSSSAIDYIKGTGYLIVARGVGIVKIVFNRTFGEYAGTTVNFDYLDHTTWPSRTISGVISDSSGDPFVGLAVQLSNCNNCISSVTNALGAFSIQAYGPEVILRFGYDDNEDGSLMDRYPEYPKTFAVDNITGDVTDLDVGVNGELPAVITGLATSVSSIMATLNGTVNPNNNSTAVVFEYGTDANYGLMAIASESPVDGSTAQSVSTALTAFNPATTYHFRVKGTNTVGTSLGDDQSFTTLATAPTVTTTAISSITASSASSGGNITSDGGAEINARGVCWSTSQNPTVSGNHTTDGTGEDAFTSDITDLRPGTTYYVRAYATNSAGTSYGNQLSFGTTTLTPTITTTAIMSVTETTAVTGGNVSSDGGAAVTAKGVCWSTSANPTVANDHTTDGSGTASFTISITGLNPGTTYHVRAYATNSAGSGYGSDVSFTTDYGSALYVCSDGNCGGKSNCHKTVESAVKAAVSGSIIKVATNITYSGNFTVSGKTLTIQGGWDTTFENESGTTTIQGAPAVSSGSATMQQLKIVP